MRLLIRTRPPMKARSRTTTSRPTRISLAAQNSRQGAQRKSTSASVAAACNAEWAPVNQEGHNLTAWRDRLEPSKSRSPNTIHQHQQYDQKFERENNDAFDGPDERCAKVQPCEQAGRRDTQRTSAILIRYSLMARAAPSFSKLALAISTCEARRRSRVRYRGYSRGTLHRRRSDRVKGFKIASDFLCCVTPTSYLF